MGHQRVFEVSDGTSQMQFPNPNQRRAHPRAQGRPRQPLRLGPGETTIDISGLDSSPTLHSLMPQTIPQTMPQGRNSESLPQFQSGTVSGFDDINDGHSQVQSHSPQLGSHEASAYGGLAPDGPAPAHNEPAQVGLDQDEPPLESLPPFFENAIRDFDDSLVLIFIVLKLKKRSLRSFLFDILESEHPYIMHQVGMFFGKGIAAELLGEWQLYCRHRETWDGPLARAAANYATDRMHKELRGLLTLKEDVLEPDNDASAVTPQQKRKRLDELDIVAEDLGLALTAEERTFFGSIAEGSGSTNSVEIMSEGQGAESGAAGEEVGIGGVSEGASITSQEPGTPAQMATATSAKLLPGSSHQWIKRALEISAKGALSASGAQGQESGSSKPIPTQARVVASQRPTHARINRQLVNVLKRNSTKSFFRRPAVAMTQEEVKSFSFDGIHERLESKAPIFHHTLRRLTEYQTAPLGIKSLDPMHDIESRTAIVGTQASMIMHCQSQRHNYFQRIMGIFFHAASCSKDVINTLAKAHICVSYDSTLAAIGSLTEDAISIVREAVLKDNWYIIYDNINLFMTVTDQRVDNADTQINGATATIVPGKDLGIVDKPYNPQATLTLDDFLPDDQAVKDAAVASRFYLVDVLQRHYSTYKRISMSPIREIRSLPIEQSITYPISAMEIDQSSVEGNLEILRFITARTLVLPATYFDNGKKIIVAGDQLTVSRVEAIKRSVDDDVTAFDRMEWALPALQLFHLQMNLCSLILKTYFGESDKPGSLSFYIARLKRKRVSEESSSYHAANELMRNVFDGMVLRLWQEELGVDSSETLDELGANQDATTMLNQVCTKAEAIRTRYIIRPEATRKAHGNANTNAALFIRDMLVYIELGDAIKQGDVGRIEAVLVPITIMFQAGGTKNYANQLLRLAFDIRHIWTEQRTDAIFSSWLVNTTGKAGGWIPSDLYQEHNNLFTKVRYSAKGSNRTFANMSQDSSVNCRTYGVIKANVTKAFGVSHNSGFHSTVSATKDVRRVVRSLEELGVLGINTRPAKDHTIKPAKDLHFLGQKNMIHGNLRSFHQSIGKLYRNDQYQGSSSEYEDSSVLGEINWRFDQEVDRELGDNEELGELSWSETDHDTDSGEGGEDGEVSSDGEFEIAQENVDDTVDIALEMIKVDINSGASDEEAIEDILRRATRDYMAEVDEGEDDDGAIACSCEDPNDPFVDHNHCKHFRHSEE